MDINQILKKVDWLDDEHRKDKTTLSRVEERMDDMQKNFPGLNHQIRELRSELIRMSTIISRMDHFDEALLQKRIETKQSVDELERQFKKREEEVDKIRRIEMRGLDKSIEELRHDLNVIPDLRRGMQARLDEENRLGRLITELSERIETVRHNEEEYTRSYRLLEDGRRQDTKRITDLQGEVAALRKRSDEQRGKVEMLSTNIRKSDTRIKELVTIEREHRVKQEEFLDKQALLQVERDRTWKEWQVRFGVIEKQAVDVEANLQALDSTHRAVKRSQQNMGELNQKVDRRINEMTEIQRLSEERFRQEWVTFKADDQKRWTNYTLTQEEQRGETQRQNEKLVERVTRIEDSIQDTYDLLQQMSDLTEKRLQGLLAITHEWVTAYERSIGHIR